MRQHVDFFLSQLSSHHPSSMVTAASSSNFAHCRKSQRQHRLIPLQGFRDLQRPATHSEEQGLPT